MRRDIPEAFRHVTLSNRNTWENATLEEWVSKRLELLLRQDHSDQLQAHWVEYMRAYSDACQRVRADDKHAGRRHAGPLSGRQRARVDEILKNEFFAGRAIPDGISPWERDFLRSSAWLDDLLSGEYCSDPRIANKLFWWLLNTEATTNLTAIRRERRARWQESVAPLAEPSRRMTKKKNPFLPHPLELIWIHRCTLRRIRELRRILERVRQVGIEQGEYNAEYPCPLCGRKYDTIKYAKNCCEEKLTDEHKQRIRNYVWLFGLGGQGHERFISDFLAMIWSAGYETTVTVEDIMEWPEWDSLESTQLFEFARKFIAFLFAAEPDTIRRKMTKQLLSDSYDHHGVAEEFRFYLDRSEPGPPFMLAPREWFLHLDNDGAPPPGPSCFPLHLPDEN